jgi:hypothetical protein
MSCRSSTDPLGRLRYRSLGARLRQQQRAGEVVRLTLSHLEIFNRAPGVQNNVTEFVSERETLPIT